MAGWGWVQPLWGAWNFNHGQVVRLSKGAELEAETWGADPSLLCLPPNTGKKARCWASGG